MTRKAAGGKEHLLPVTLHVALLQVRVAIGDLTCVASVGVRGGDARLGGGDSSHDGRTGDGGGGGGDDGDGDGGVEVLR